VEFKSLEKVKEDGRLKRSERSRQAIIEAMIESMEQGCYMPLYKEITEIQKPSYAEHFVLQDLSGSLEDRIARLVTARITGYLKIFHLERATHALLWRSEVIRHNYRNSQKLLRSLLFKMLPELKDQAPYAHEVADSITSFEYFERLHTFQELSVTDCKHIIIERLIDLLVGNADKS